MIDQAFQRALLPAHYEHPATIVVVDSLFLMSMTAIQVISACPRASLLTVGNAANHACH